MPLSFPPSSGSLKNNVATTDPVVGSDNTLGYAAGSLWYNTVRGLLWEANSVATGAAVWHPVSTPANPGYISGRCYTGNIGTVFGTTDTKVTGEILYHPFRVLFRCTIDGLFTQCTATSANTVRIGVYGTTTGFKPGNLLGKVATPPATNDGNNGGSVVSNFTVIPGWYWYATAYSGTTQVCSLSNQDRRVSDLMGRVGGPPTQFSNGVSFREVVAYSSDFPSTATPGSPVQETPPLCAFRVL